MEVVHLTKPRNRGRRLGMDIPDGGAEIVLALPSNVTLTCVSVHASAALPRTTVRLLARSTNTEIGAVYLKTGVMYTIGSVTFGCTWDGRVSLDGDYENEVRANIFNRSGANVRCGVTAYWEEKN